MKIILFLLILSSIVLGQNHILITEIVVQPTAGEFVEILNNTDQTIDLSDYYLTDATFAGGGAYYYNIVTGNNAGGGSFSDFHARFPAGASIAPGEFQTIAMNGTDFSTTYGQKPSYELFNTDATVPDMREALTGSINGQGGLTNAGEVVVLYYWNGQSDLVQDIDYVVWGDKAEAVDKTGVSIDGPDADNTPSTYLNDTAIAQQISLSAAEPHSPGESSQRLDLVESGETAAGGNGIYGHDETSENLPASFSSGSPNPGTGPVSNKGPVIANVVQDPQFPASSDVVAISADVTDDGQVVSVRLFSSFNAAPYDSAAMTAGAGDSYSAVIDSQTVGTAVSWFIKAEDDSGLTTQSPTYSYTVSGPDTLTPIRDIQEDGGYIGKEVTVQGVVTVGAGIIASDWTDAYIQDNSGRGINIYRSGTPVDPLLVRGNLVRIKGTVDEFSGITEIVDYTIELLGTGQALPDPLELNTSEANNTGLEGTYILAKGIITDKFVAGPGTNLVIDDGSGPLAIRAWDTAQLDLNAFVLNDTVAVLGVMDLFNNDAQILLSYQNDIYQTTFSSEGDGSGSVSVTPDSVGRGASVNLAFSFTGTVADTVASISVQIPADWNWPGSPGDVVLSGTAFNAATVAVDGGAVVLESVELTTLNSGIVTINALTSPDADTVSVFNVRTAAIGGSLQPVAQQPSVLIGKGTAQTFTPIADIQTNIEFWNGRQVTISGVVTIGSGILITTRTTAYVQDNSGYGIQVFSFDAPDARLKRGNLVVISGTVEDYQGLVTEITDYTLSVLQTGVDIPDPLQIRTTDATDLEREGTFVEIQATVIDKYSAGGGTNIVVDDGSGEVTLRIWDSANLDLADFNPGDGIVARGVIGEFSGAGQILVAYQEDIAPVELPKAAFTLKVPNKPFAPDRGENFPVTYSAGSEDAHVVLRIYDLGGRLITTLVDEQGKPFEQVVEWNGRNQINEMVPLGAYILHLEVVSNTDGKTQVETAPIVVGTILKF